METVVWQRNPGVVQDLKLLLYLMTDLEFRRWRALEVAGEEMRKHMPGVWSC